MHLLAISLLAILAGTLLLAKFKKDAPGKFFAFISWFFIVVGFILFIGFIAGGICKMTCKELPWRSCCQHEMVMKKCDPVMKGDVFCPHGMHKGICPKKPGCMPHDSMMKVCPKKMVCDSTKMPVKEE